MKIRAIGLLMVAALLGGCGLAETAATGAAAGAAGAEAAKDAQATQQRVVEQLDAARQAAADQRERAEAAAE